MGEHNLPYLLTYYSYMFKIYAINDDDDDDKQHQTQADMTLLFVFNIKKNSQEN